MAASNKKRGIKCPKFLVMLYNFIFWIFGFALLAVGVWLLIDPRRNYVLNFVIIAEYQPLLYYAACIFVGVGAASLFVGFVGCCGAFREIQCFLVAYIILLALIMCGEIVSGLLGIVWYSKFSNYMPTYLYNMTTWRYGREKWVTEIIDTVQFYQKCCGFNSTTNYFMSYWQITYSGGTLYRVPQSCCVQRQEAYPPDNILPVDDWCQFYEYNSTGQMSAVYTTGCYNKLMSLFQQTSTIFIAVGFGAALFQVFGLVCSIYLCVQIGRIYKTYTT